MYFQNYGLGNTWLYKYLKSPVSEDSSRGNMVNRPKDLFSINGSTFTIFIDHCEGS